MLLFIEIILGQSPFKIELMNERGYPMEIDENGTYNITIGEGQAIFKVKGLTNSLQPERVTWKTKEKFYWGDGLRNDIYPVVNPASYTKNGVGYSMVGLMPEMRGKTITIYGYYHQEIDSLKIFVR